MANASLLTLGLTNQFNLPDTNLIKVVQADTNTPSADNGSVHTIGLPVRVTPDTNGVVTIFRATGNYVLYGPTLGAGVLYRFPDSSSNATAYKLSGFNTFETVVQIVPTNQVPATVVTNGTGSGGAVVTQTNNTLNIAADAPGAAAAVGTTSAVNMTNAANQFTGTFTNVGGLWNANNNATNPFLTSDGKIYWTAGPAYPTGVLAQSSAGSRYWINGNPLNSSFGNFYAMSGLQVMDTNGNLTANSYSGNGAGLTNVTAANLSGNIGANQVTNLVTGDAYVTAFTASNNIPSGSFTYNALNSMMAVFKAAGYYGAITNGGDVLLFGNQFAPTNNLTFMGRKWSAMNGFSLPLFGDPNWASFYYTNGLVVNGLNLTNYMIVEVFQMNPAAYPIFDASIYTSGSNNTYNSTIAFQNTGMVSWSTLNTNTGGGTCCFDYGSDQGPNGGYQFFTDHSGVTSNSWSYGGLKPDNGPGYCTNSISPYTVNGIWGNRSYITRTTAATTCYAGSHQGWLDGVGGLWVGNNNSYSTANSNILQEPIYDTNPITTFRLGADTNANSFAWRVGYGFYANSLHQEEAVFILNLAGITNVAAVANAAYAAGYYADTRRAVNIIYGTSIMCDFQAEGSPSYFLNSTNSLTYALQQAYPDALWMNQSMGGASLSSTTNAAGYLPNGFPFTTATLIPKDFKVTAATDLMLNDAYSYALTGTALQSLETKALAQLITNNIPILAFASYTAGTNSGRSPLVPPIILQNNQSYYTNGIFAGVINESRHVTYGLFNVASPDQTHLTKSGVGYRNCIVSEWGNRGPFNIAFPDIASAPNAFTNMFGTVMRVNCTAATVLNIYNLYGSNVYGGSLTIAAPFNFELAPLEYYTSSTMTGQILTRSQQ